MNNRFDIVFITTIPAFYKVNLFNEIAKKKSILVLYTGSRTGIRSLDFLDTNSNFEHIELEKSILKSIIQLLRIIHRISFERLIVSGWDNAISYLSVLVSPMTSNACIVESSILESNVYGLKSVPKRFLLKRVSRVYASGISQSKLVKALGFKGEIIEFGGCGILNYKPQQAFQARRVVRDFLYVGQLIEKKNVSLLVECFNDYPELSLTIIGDGVMRAYLQGIANDNIVFLGAVNNSELTSYYRKADVFILPSKVEPWGLVVEEALNNGTPVIVSSMVGCADSIVSPFSAGVIFQSGNKDSLKMAIKQISNIEYYNGLRDNVSKMDFIERGRYQIDSFIK